MSERPDICAINLARRTAVLDDGRTVPITNLFDRDGEETAAAAAAVSFVAGAGAEWFSGRVDRFTGTIQ